MEENEKHIEEYLNLNGIKMKDQTKQKIDEIEQYIDPDIEVWYKSNNMQGAITTLKDAKMKKRIEELKVKLSRKGSKVLGLKDETDKEKIKKDIDEALEQSEKQENKTEKNNKEKTEKESEEKDIAEDNQGVGNSANKDSKEEKSSVKEGKENKKQEQDKPKTAEERKKEEQEYLDKLIKLHSEKMKVYKDQRKRDKLVPSDSDLIFMIRLQQEINKGRVKYEKEYGKEELTKILNKHFKEEKKEESKILEEHQKKIDKLEDLNKQLDEVLGKIEALEYQMSRGQISIEDYENEKEFLQKQKVETLWDINEMDPAMLAEEEMKFKENENFQNKAFGQGFEKQQRKDLDMKNFRTSKDLEQTKKEQQGEIKETNEAMEERHKRSIDNKEETIDELQSKIANETDEEKIVEYTEQAAKLEEDIEKSDEQQKMVQGKEDVGYTDIENATTIEGDFSEKLENAMVDFKKVIDEQEQLKEEIAPETNKEENEFIRNMQNSIVDIEGDPNAAREYLEAIKETTERAREYNEELKEVKDTPEIK